LLVILDALLIERGVTVASRRIGLSQTATSNALARLRALLDDPVLLRTATVGSTNRPAPAGRADPGARTQCPDRRAGWRDRRPC
jgi:DNA-binding transcriptional LysR family regulator